MVTVMFISWQMTIKINLNYLEFSKKSGNNQAVIDGVRKVYLRISDAVRLELLTGPELGGIAGNKVSPPFGLSDLIEDLSVDLSIIVDQRFPTFLG